MGREDFLVADVYTLEESDAFEDKIVFLHESDMDRKIKFENEVKLNSELLNHVQTMVASYVSNGVNVVFAAPSSAGKTFVTIWSTYHGLKEKKRFAYVVQDKYHRDSMFNAISGAGCKNLHAVDDLLHVKDSSNLVITVGKLDEMHKKGMTNSIKLFIFDNIDQLQDERHGYVWEELLMKLPIDAQYLFTSSNFSNIDAFARWIVTIQEKHCHVIVAKKRLPQFSFNLSIPKDLNNMKMYCVSNLSDEFSIGKNVFDAVMNDFVTPSNTRDVVKLADLVESLFLIRSTIRQLCRHNGQVIVVAFDEHKTELYGLDIGRKIRFLKDNKKDVVRRIINDFSQKLSRDSEESLLLERLKNIYMNGVAYLSTSMPTSFQELVCSLFRHELLKVLIVTEEVAINSNLRGKNVICTSCRKFDGSSYRYLTNYEWQRLMCLAYENGASLQGARVTLILDWKVSYETLKQIVLPQKSEFRSALASCPYFASLESRVVCRSFHRFLQSIHETFAQVEIKRLQARLNQLDEVSLEGQLKVYLELIAKRDLSQQQLDELSYSDTSRIVPYLNCGRLVKVVDGKKDFGFGIVVFYGNLPTNNNPRLFVALKISRDCRHNLHDFRLLVPAHPDENQVSHVANKLPIALVMIAEVPLECIKIVYTTRIRLPEDLRDSNNFNFLQVLLNGIGRYIVKRVEIDDPEVHERRKKLQDLEAKLNENPLPRREDYANLLKQYEDRQECKALIEENQKFVEEYQKAPFFNMHL